MSSPAGAARSGGSDAEILSAERRALLLSAVREAAAQAILPRFRALEPSHIATKSGPADLVTLADTEAEALIQQRVGASWPAAVVLGEESVAASPDLREIMGTADPCVVVDPVDGTWNFAKGLAVFGVLLAVLRQGRPVWGLLYDPVMDDWIEALPGQQTRFVSARGVSQPLATSSEIRPGRLTGYMPLGLFRREDRARIVAEFPDFLRITSLRCAAHEYRMVAQGHAEFCLSGPTPHPWDHAAGVLAVEGAGGVARFLDGSPYDARRRKGVLLAAGSQAAWEHLAERFAFLA
ncbi:inositol monophosphatase [Rubellimicrobium sp. CFH 75288]|uniref:inositol monophosphatase family protein n=1 Tax=Rubellimicrobium sp. CFH 75288 TaxID=2697034 RepID=UPI0014123A17|nr:inositol monophosphatase [Rubellimicrobium sp. CFH 75288]NAZ35743.1 inositol monophosphatase [Rubellimicrobium sp. CFH 75288]